MKKITIGNVTVELGTTFIDYNDEAKEGWKTLDEYVEDRAETVVGDFMSLLRHRKLAYFIEDHVSVAILAAHGTEGPNGEWCYVDDEDTAIPVEEWIKSFDGKADVIFLYVCNEKSVLPQTEISFLIAPMQIFSAYELDMETISLGMWLPMIGEVDFYTVEHYLKGFFKLRHPK